MSATSNGGKLAMVKFMNAVKLTILLVLGSGLTFSTTARGDEPSTRPVMPGGNFPMDIRSALRSMFMTRQANIVHFTQDEWNDMMSFMETYSPARAAVLERADLPEESTVRQVLIRKWRAYKFVKDHFPEMAKLQERRFTLEDDLFVLAMREKDREADAGSPTADSSQDLHDLIHAKVADLVALGIAEDQLRIERLKRMLGDLNAKLAADQASEQRRIEDRTQRLMGSYPWPATRPSANSPRADGGNGETATVSNQTDTAAAADSN
jgi:hypothetical protein